MKIIGVGLNRTGTGTLDACFRHWGLRHASWSPEAFALWRQRRFDEITAIMRNFDSFADWPWPLIYPEIDLRFPGSKFILTRRKDPQTWFRSLCRHADRTGPTEFRTHIYGFAMPHGHEAEHIAFYNEHLRAVRAYFRGREDFLEVCWEEGDGWQILSTFLGFECPKLPFPQVNPSRV